MDSITPTIFGIFKSGLSFPIMIEAFEVKQLYDAYKASRLSPPSAKSLPKEVNRESIRVGFARNLTKMKSAIPNVCNESRQVSLWIGTV